MYGGNPLFLKEKGMKRYTPEEVQFVRDNLPGRPRAELLEMFNKRFGLSINKGQMDGLISRKKLRNSLPPHRFKPGHPGFNQGHSIGTEREKKDFTEVKIGKGKYGWKFKHRLIWEAANGPVPDGHAVIFADGDKTNFDPDNLILVSPEENIVMIFNGLITPDRDLTKAGKAVAALKLLIADRERKIGKRRIRRKNKMKDKLGGASNE
jgi:hypothetical protein